MNLLADENVDRAIVERLRQDGHAVHYVAELVAGVSDDVVLATANERGALLLTADKDFGELVFRQRRVTTGVVLVRLAGLSPTGKAAIVASNVAKHAQELPGNFTVISAGSVRIRRSID
jgi:predicted nuclease of predicted toxin-antitoxin system